MRLTSGQSTDATDHSAELGLLSPSSEPQLRDDGNRDPEVDLLEELGINHVCSMCFPCALVRTVSIRVKVKHS